MVIPSRAVPEAPEHQNRFEMTQSKLPTDVRRCICQRCIVWGAKFADSAGAFKKGIHVQIDGELRSREFQKDGVTNRVAEVRVHSVVQIRQAWRQTETHPPDAETTDSPA